MLTPRFKLSQDENHVFITVHAPYTNIGETEIDIEGDNFLFVSTPYFLRLRLPGRIVENDHSKGSYTCDSGDFSLTFDKDTPGEHFEHLDMITSLLAPRDIPDVNPNLIAVLDGDEDTLEEQEEVDDDTNHSLLGVTYPFGFADSISTEFKEIGIEFPQIFELKVPEQVPVDERNVLRQKYEEHKYSPDHYLADFFDHELLAPYLSPTMYWDSPDFEQVIDFTEEEISILKELPNKHYYLSKAKQMNVLYGLVDILFGYCYDRRTTLNECNVESSWTINKLSATLSWFCTFADTKEVLVACYRRALVYPIFRNYDLCNKIKNDLVSLLRNGKIFTIKCVINIYQMFNSSNDARYILNHLYIKDYLIFLQKCSAEEFGKLSNNIADIDITKDDLMLDLVELEAAAHMVQREETLVIGNEMAVKMASMSLMPGLNKLSDCYAYDSDSSTSSDSSSDSSDESSLDSDDEPA